MSTSTAICLDTEVFDRLNYNFSETTLQKFVALCKDRKIKLLLPAPIKDEIDRHMVERAKELDTALNKVASDARRKASFLDKWERFPKPTGETELSGTMRRLCIRAWNTFAKQLDVELLAYEGVDLGDIMFKYHFVRPPFASGDKRKEFPDAISLAILDVFTRKHDTTVAVVSGDAGMKAGCDGYQNLLYFPSLSSLVETLLAEDERVELYVNLINASMGDLASILGDVISDNASFPHGDRLYSSASTQITEIDVSSFDIIGLGVNECTIAFSAQFDSDHELRWEDHEPDGRPFLESGWISQTFEFGGTAKVKFSADDKEMVSCDHVEIDTHEFELSRSPRHW